MTRSGTITFQITLPLALFAAGTGAAWVQERPGTGGSFVQPHYRAFSDNVAANNAKPHGVAEDIDYIKEALGLSVSELSRFLGVSRQAIYDWREGKHIKPSNLSKLENLKDAADTLTASDVEVTSLHLNRKLGGGRTMLETISAGGSGRIAAAALIDMLRRETATRDEMNRLLASRPVTTQSRIGLGLAALRE